MVAVIVMFPVDTIVDVVGIVVVSVVDFIVVGGVLGMTSIVNFIIGVFGIVPVDTIVIFLGE